MHSVYSKLVKYLSVISLSKIRYTFTSENRWFAKFTQRIKFDEIQIIELSVKTHN
jgi:hypothetical protein